MLTLDPTSTKTPCLRSAPPPVRSPLQALRRCVRLGLSRCARRVAGGAAWLRGAGLRWLAAPKLQRGLRSGPARLCLGSGNAPIPGWVNIDLDGAPDVRLDLAHRLPVADGAIDLIYSEHLIEHLSCEQGLALLRECRRVLGENGVLRIATPDLQALVAAYDGDWRDQDWVRWRGHEWIDSAARMLNQAFRGWGHQHLYDEQELTLRLRTAGFAEIRREAIGESTHRELAGLETRADSKLILEARGKQETIR